MSAATRAWSADLTYGYLQRLLAATREVFSLRPLRDGAATESDTPRAIVRHDVDVCLQRAVALAEHEARWGVRSTYLVQVDCPLYRLDDAAGDRALRRLRELGHEIGLHVYVGSTARVEGATGLVVELRIYDARERLEARVGLSIESFSFHRPAPALLRGPDRLCGMVNAYGTAAMAAYLSDSEGRWREGEPLPSVRATSSHTLQLLIHPIWWAEDHRSPGVRLQELFERRTEEMTEVEAEVFDVELLRAIGPARRSGLDHLDRGQTLATTRTHASGGGDGRWSSRSSRNTPGPSGWKSRDG
jgi:hypothetical protein